MKVGQMVHKLRKDRNMTLLELSERSGVALATLSRMENGKMTGTLESHLNICRALNVSLPDIYKDLISSPEKVDIRSRKPEAEISVHDRRSSSELLALNSAGKKMVPVMSRISKGGSLHPEAAKPGSEKFVYVLDGKLEAVVGSEKYDLSKGDSLYFESSIKHLFRNAGPSETRFISVTSQQ